MRASSSNCRSVRPSVCLLAASQARYGRALQALASHPGIVTDWVRTAAAAEVAPGAPVAWEVLTS